jgi:hypothetical protein
MDKIKFDEFYIFGMSIKIQFFPGYYSFLGGGGIVKFKIHSKKKEHIK